MLLDALKAVGGEDAVGVDEALPSDANEVYRCSLLLCSSLSRNRKSRMLNAWCAGQAVRGRGRGDAAGGASRALRSARRRRLPHLPFHQAQVTAHSLQESSSTLRSDCVRVGRRAFSCAELRERLRRFRIHNCVPNFLPPKNAQIQQTPGWETQPSLDAPGTEDPSEPTDMEEESTSSSLAPVLRHYARLP